MLLSALATARYWGDWPIDPLRVFALEPDVLETLLLSKQVITLQWLSLPSWPVLTSRLSLKGIPAIMQALSGASGKRGAPERFQRLGCGARTHRDANGNILLGMVRNAVKLQPNGKSKSDCLQQSPNCLTPDCPYYSWRLVAE